MIKMKTIVVSAVNLRQGGTLTILRDCLCYLSKLSEEQNFRVVAIVHKRDLCDFPNVEYIEFPDVVKGWHKRLWCEYVTMYKISKRLQPIALWLSLHDTTPRVIAQRQAVYCQTSFPFYKWIWKDLYFNPKIVLFALFTRFAYRINVHRNNFMIVQQDWLREGLSKMLGVDKDKFIVAPPEKTLQRVVPKQIHSSCYTFLYPAAPDCHKNYQVLCEATKLLESEIGRNTFSVVITIDGTENRYTKWLKKTWGDVPSIAFNGYMAKEELYGYYFAADCLVFPSKVETWGLPISEFMETGKPMIIADCPYAHGTVAGSLQTCFFYPNDPVALKELMKDAIKGDMNCFKTISKSRVLPPVAYSWKDIFNTLLSN